MSWKMFQIKPKVIINHDLQRTQFSIIFDAVWKWTRTNILLVGYWEPYLQPCEIFLFWSKSTIWKLLKEHWEWLTNWVTMSWPPYPHPNPRHLTLYITMYDFLSYKQNETHIPFIPELLKLFLCGQQITHHSLFWPDVLTGAAIIWVFRELHEINNKKKLVLHYTSHHSDVYS